MMFVIRLVVAEPHLASKAGFGQKLEGAVNGCMADRRIEFVNEPVEVFAGQVVLGAQERLKYQVALPGTAQPGGLDMLEKDLFFHLKTVFCFSHLFYAPLSTILPFQF